MDKYIRWGLSTEEWEKEKEKGDKKVLGEADGPNVGLPGA